MSTIGQLLEKAAKKHNISVELLTRLLKIERTFLYVAEGEPRFVVERLLETIREAAEQ